MADDTTHRIIVVFKNGTTVYYRITKEQLDRLSLDYQNSGGKSITRVYDVIGDEDEKRVLMLNFADVLYIG